MVRICAAIFDMDGVLVNTEPLYLKLNGDFFVSKGITLAEVGYDQYVGSSALYMWKKIKEQFGLPESIEELIQGEKDRFFNYVVQLSKLDPIPGISELLQELSENNIPIALASSSARKNINLVLKKSGLEKYFRVIVSGEDVKNGKPAPDIFLKTAELLGILPERCLVIEDSANGTNGAKDAGMKVIGYKNSSSGNQNLDRADLIVTDFSSVSRKQIMRFFQE